MKRKLLFALIVVATGFAGCKKADPPIRAQQQSPAETENGITQGGCVIPPASCNGVLCTAHFAEVVLEVKNAAGSPATVDSFVVTDLAGIALPRTAGGLPVYGYLHAENGQYTVINDGWVQGHQQTNIQVRAKGFIGGLQVFNEPFTIVTDCCHVEKFSGKDAITIP